jgi:hypothetical protein
MLTGWTIWVASLHPITPGILIVLLFAGAIIIAWSRRHWRPVRALIAGLSLAILTMITFLQADQAVRQGFQATFACSQAAFIAARAGVPMPQDNAALDYPALDQDLNHLQMISDQEGSAFNRWDMSWENRASNDLPPLSPAEEQALQMVTERIHRTHAKPGFLATRDWSQSIVLLKELSTSKQIIKVLSFQALRDLRDGRTANAWRHFLAMQRVSLFMHSEPILVNQLVASAHASVCFSLAQRLATRGTTTMPQPNPERLGEPWSASLLRSYIGERSWSLQLLLDEGMLTTHLASDQDEPVSMYWLGFSLRLYRIFSLDSDFRRVEWRKREMDDILDTGGFPAWKEFQRQWEEERLHRRFFPALGVVSPLHLPLLDTAWFLSGERFIRADAQRRVLHAALLAAAHHRNKGVWPTTFGDEWPTDPYLEPCKRDKTGPPLAILTPHRLRTRIANDHLLIWSVGPDGTDDNGAPYDEKAKTGDIVLTVAP